MEIKGIITPILTPMYEDESINYEELKNQINRLIVAGVHGLFFFGTNGESYILTPEEKKKVLEVAVETVAHRVPVYAGTGCIGTKETIAMSKMAEDIGADVLSIITPWFAAISQDELIAHYMAVAAQVKTPIVLYNIPGRTGVNMAPETIATLADVDLIVGAKDSSGNFNNMLQYIALTKDKDFSVLSGNDSLILWCLLAGGKGGIAGCSNVYPKDIVGIYENFIAGDIQKAKECQYRIQDLRAVFKYGNPNTIIKKATQMLGYPVGDCRAPFNGLSEKGVQALEVVLENYRKIGME
ncbi:MAG: 4-hydroxy-tetrahydrodipicolinate synthase [Spirochaetia bacterium]|jgi:4-hydroxy-tetrahydrodipicolinate synthase|nr:4-hydroxy-tetrahydrodipicolinate synthase [Spirochaetia bacterium]